MLFDFDVYFKKLVKRMGGTGTVVLKMEKKKGEQREYLLSTLLHKMLSSTDK